MVDLEKHIRDLRNQLDSDKPREGHKERFMLKLDRPVRRLNFRHVLQVAASVAIILTSAVVLVKKNTSGDKIAAREVPEAVQEANLYYTTQVSARYDQIRAFDFDQAEEKNMLLNELQDLDAYHQQLMEDLGANPDDERVINALIRHYQLKLEVMDQIIIQLNQIKTETTENNENESV
jgi:hypothetical protein